MPSTSTSTNATTSSSSSDSGALPLAARQYARAGISAALRRRVDYARAAQAGGRGGGLGQHWSGGLAVPALPGPNAGPTDASPPVPAKPGQELTAFFTHAYAGAAKDARAALEADAAAALESPHMAWAAGSAAASGLLRAATAVVPAAKARHLARLARDAAIGRVRAARAERSAAATVLAGPAADAPRDVLVHAFSWLGPADLARCQVVCTHWRVAADDDGLWRNLLGAHFAQTAAPPGDARTAFARAAAGYVRNWRRFAAGLVRLDG